MAAVPCLVTTFAQVLDGVLRSEAAACPPPGAPCGPTFDEIRGALDVFADHHRGARRPAWAVELDVELPCDATAVRRAFRRRALQTHPDHAGGSHDAFLRTMQALDEGLFAVGG